MKGEGSGNGEIEGEGCSVWGYREGRRVRYGDGRRLGYRDGRRVRDRDGRRLGVSYEVGLGTLGRKVGMRWLGLGLGYTSR